MRIENATSNSGNTAKEISPAKQLILLGPTVFCVCFLMAMPASAQQGGGGVASIIATSTPIAVAFMISILVLKVTAFVLGYFIVKLGHDTMIRGVTGEVDFGFSGSGFETKLKSASPGAFFILMGSAIILWGLTVDKPFTVEVPPQQQTKVVKSVSESGSNLHRPKLPE